MPRSPRSREGRLVVPRMVYTDGFLDDAAAIWSDRVQGRLERMLSAIEAFPEIGSPDIPASIRAVYGIGVRKAVVEPFDLIYEYHPDTDTVIVYGLVPLRAAP